MRVKIQCFAFIKTYWFATKDRGGIQDKYKLLFSILERAQVFTKLQHNKLEKLEFDF